MIRTRHRSSEYLSHRGRAAAYWYLLVLSTFGFLLWFEDILAWAAEVQPAENVFPDPGLTNPRLRFHTGEPGPGGPVISPILPNISGAPSAWFVTQWYHEGPLLRPDAMTENDPLTRDPHLGVASYAFTAPDSHAHVWIYRDEPHHNFVFDLYERGGGWTSEGGTNLFLTAYVAAKDARLDAEVDYSFSAELTKASVAFNDPAAIGNGVVAAQIFSGFIFHIDESDSNKPATVFLQIQFADSRNNPIDYHSCHYDDRSVNILFSRNLPSDPWLPFSPDTGLLRPLNYVLNRYVCAFLSRPLHCIGPQGQQPDLAIVPAAADFKNWRLTSMYIGLETQDHDIRPTSANRSKQGSVEAGVQIADLRVTRYPERSFDRASCATPSMTLLPVTQ
jgi:hypothetical protein